MNLTLIDFKIEVGYDADGKMYVVDEITPRHLESPRREGQHPQPDRLRQADPGKKSDSLRSMNPLVPSGARGLCVAETFL